MENRELELEGNTSNINQTFGYLNSRVRASSKTLRIDLILAEMVCI